jgi:hypothetical protein
MQKDKNKSIENPIEEVTPETTTGGDVFSPEETPETPETQNATQPETVDKVKNWSQRTYYVRKAETFEIVADSLSDEKSCRAWIASNQSEFDTPYMINYRVQSLSTITKTQKVILK